MQPPGKLPPLSALRAFEVAARLGSVTAAADELHVTHSAVSQQIKSLENSLGVKLFSRSGRHVVLTAAGRELAIGANEALCALARTTKQVRQRANPRRLTVTTIPSFAACWLTPRISRFLEQVPDAELNILSTSTPARLPARGNRRRNPLRLGAL
jgi:LysR family glycine cleavage system transcriptional activator